MRLARVSFIILAVGCIFYVVLHVTPLSWWASRDREREQETVSERGAVPVNRSADVLDGFRGVVHPLLHGSTRLEVAAHWAPVGKGRDRMHETLHPAVYAWFTNLQPARPRETYTERDFSAFLPETVGEVGQLWAIDTDKAAAFLRQFHPRVSMQLVAPGRRAGPDGAFAILRAQSASHLEIVFRIHAEIYLAPDSSPTIGAWYTPSYFSGRVLVDKRTGTVSHFQLAIPTEKALNVHLTVQAKHVTDKRAHDIVRVERMELTGGDGRLAEQIAWTQALTVAEAGARLAKVFYKFEEIDWVPVDQAMSLARKRGRPIFAIVSWGATDDQSC